MPELLDPDDPRPPYKQVEAALREDIRIGEYAPGEQLPTQAQLCTRYGVARMTVQRALRILSDEGLIVTRQGKGTFVRMGGFVRPDLDGSDALTSPEMSATEASHVSEHLETKSLVLYALLLDDIDIFRTATFFDPKHFGWGTGIQIMWSDGPSLEEVANHLLPHYNPEHRVLVGVAGLRMVHSSERLVNLRWLPMPELPVTLLRAEGPVTTFRINFD